MYTFAQLEQAWINAGGPAAVAPIAAAIAATESSFGTNNQGDYYNGVGYTSFGPWQIHVLDQNGNPVNTQANGQPYDTSQLTNNLAYDASAAVAVYNQQGFNAWTTFTNGSYLANLPSSASASASTTSATPAASSAGAIPVTTAVGFTPVALSSTTTTLILVATFVFLMLALFAMGKKPQAAA